MPRKRDIKPSIATNEVLAELPPLTRLLFSWLPMWADREGRLEDRPKRLKGEIFPHDTVDMDKMLQELHDSNFIVRYTVKGERFIQITNFVKHQKPHPNEATSVIPAPDSKRRRGAPRSEGLTTMDDSADVQEVAGVPPETEALGSSPITLTPITLTPSRERVAKAPARSRRKPEIPLPADFIVTLQMREWAEQKVPTVNVDSETEKFMDHAEAKDARYVDWPAAWRNWMRHSLDFAPRSGSGNGAGRERSTQERAEAIARKIDEGRML